MNKRKANQYVPKIIADLSEGRYSLKRVPGGERDPSRLCRIKKLFKKLKKAKGELLEDRIILFFELGKELGDDKIYVGEKMIDYVHEGCTKVLKRATHGFQLVKIGR